MPTQENAIMFFLIQHERGTFMHNPLCVTPATISADSSTRVRPAQWQIFISKIDKSALSTTVIHLRTLGLLPDLDGYRYLTAAIPLYAINPGVRLHKELYCDIVEICGANDTLCVEHSIRSAIKGAWLKHDPTLWAHYFPLNKDGNIDCPSNKLFIATLSEMI